MLQETGEPLLGIGHGESLLSRLPPLSSVRTERWAGTPRWAWTDAFTKPITAHSSAGSQREQEEPPSDRACARYRCSSVADLDLPAAVLSDES